MQLRNVDEGLGALGSVRSRLPAPRGPRSGFLFEHLVGGVHEIGELPPPVAGIDDDDSALALHVLYELHYQGFAEVDERFEWEPSVLAARAALEGELEGRLVDLVGPPPVGAPVTSVVEELDRLAAGDDGPSLSAWMLEHGDLQHFREFAVHRSIYQLKEADPHTWAIPRLVGTAKAAMVEIQTDEYGEGVADAMHSSLFATTMDRLGLDDRYGAYLDRIPGTTLTTTNVLSMFGLHRRWRGAVVGHLALFEMCSVGPMGRYAAALRRLGVDARAARFYDVHVEADAHHEVVARDRLAAGLVSDEPRLAGDVIFGARALSAVEATFARHLLDSWASGRTSLLPPLAEAA